MTAAATLSRDGSVALDFGAARARVRMPAPIPGFDTALDTLYHAFTPLPLASFCDVTVRLCLAGRSKLATLVVDGEQPFAPFDCSLHLPLLEWGINLMLAKRLLHVLLLHAGVVALDDRAIVMPALPGSGKSTLCAALSSSGFRLLSDEFGVVDLQAGTLLPLVRPIALKNASIDVIRCFAPTAVIGPSFPNTRKGTVAHVAPDSATVAARNRPAQPAAIVFPQYLPGAATTLAPVARPVAFSKLAINAFNYALLGALGFRAVARLVESSTCIALRYSKLDEAIDALVDLVSRPPAP